MIPRISYKRVAEENAVQLRAATAETVRLAAVAFAWREYALALVEHQRTERAGIRLVQALAVLRDLGIDPEAP